ncbi:MAG: NAD(P)-dependent oxidoreductase [Prochloraceae cyanobacterium]|nr:NAD(P)-dependent oxidoreductase [Prochloraceae cyanobacterium]
MTNKQIAFLGLGLMGGPMTANLARSEYPVKAWNRTKDRPGVEIAKNAGAAIAKSIREAVETADIIFTCVGDVPDVREVIFGTDGIAKHAKSNALIVDMSTIGSQAAMKIAAELKQFNLRFLDAPVSGGDIGAQKGTLTIMVGGDRGDFEECLPLFEIMGQNITLCGPVGSGQAVKLCNQVLCAVHAIALCEAMELAKIQGIDPNLIVDVCGTGAAGSWALSNLGPKIINSDLAPGFPIEHIIKDLRLVAETIEDGKSLPGFELADRFFKFVGRLDDGAGLKQGTQAMIRAYRVSDRFK